MAESAISQSLALCQRIPPKQLAQILRRLAISLKERNNATFSRDEISFMLESYELTPAEFDSMFSACQYIFQQAACYLFDSDRLASYAESQGASEDVVQCFVAVWDLESDELIDALKGSTLSESTLRDTQWRLDINATDDAGMPKKELLGKELHRDIENVINERGTVVARKDEQKFVHITDSDPECEGQVIQTIISEGDAVGAVVVIVKKDRKIGEIEQKAATIAATFLGKQMEG